METTRRLLQRNPSEGKIGGVAAGLADYFDIDPTIVRLAFVLLVFAGGFGIAAYLVAWLVMPAGDGSSAKAPGRPTDESRWALGLVVVAVGVAALVGAGSFWWLGQFALWPFVLIAAGLGLLLWHRDTQRRSPSAGPPAPHASTPGPVADPPDETTQPTRVLAAPADQARHRGVRVGWITLAVICLSAIVAVVLDATGAVEVSPRWFLVYALGVAAAGIAAGALFGRVLGSVVLALVLAASLAVAWIVDAPVRWSSGDRVIAPVTVSELDDEYLLGAGTLVLDLRRLELDGATRAVDASVSVGKLVVLPPDDAITEIDARASLGEVELYGRTERGVDVASSAGGPVTPSSADRLQLDLRVGIGKVEVASRSGWDVRVSPRP